MGPLIQWRPGEFARYGEQCRVTGAPADQMWELAEAYDGPLWVPVAPVLSTIKPFSLRALRVDEESGRRYYV